MTNEELCKYYRQYMYNNLYQQFFSLYPAYNEWHEAILNSPEWQEVLSVTDFSSLSPLTQRAVQVYITNQNLPKVLES
jgi:hypothetical protein